jgi:hypothetical protein
MLDKIGMAPVIPPFPLHSLRRPPHNKDEGHAMIDQTDADNIINTATTQEIYGLTLGLSDKVRRVLIAGKAHKASTITFWGGKGGSDGGPQLLIAGINHHYSHIEQEETSCQVGGLGKNSFSIGV